MEFALNGLPVLSATLDMPLRGAWVADVVVDCDDRERVLGRVTIDNAAGSWELSGTARLGDVDPSGKTQIRIVGGAGGLANQLEPKFYRAIPASIVLGDALDGGSEQLASSSDSGALETILPGWTRMQTTVAEELDALASVLGATWRVLPGGSLWFGVDIWPKDTTAFDFIEEHPHEGRVVIGPFAPTLVPGTTFLGRAVVHVTHTISPGSLRTEVLFER